MVGHRRWNLKGETSKCATNYTFDRLLCLELVLAKRHVLRYAIESVVSVRAEFPTKMWAEGTPDNQCTYGTQCDRKNSFLETFSLFIATFNPLI